MRTCSLIALTVFFLPAASSRAMQPEDSTGGVALNLLFDSRDLSDVPQSVRSRALLARTSFVDLVKQTKRKLQIAFLIDGTDSMGEDINGVLNSLNGMSQDLSRWKHDQGSGPEVSFAVAVYRDVGSPSGPLTFPKKQFTSDLGQLESAIKGIRTETGAPAFQELMDVGIYKTITELDWSSDEDTTKWIIVFGDAPPFKEGQQIANTGRFHKDKELVEAAAKQGIVLNFVLCSSGFTDEGNAKLKETFAEALPYTREFVQGLAGETGGAILDLSDPEIRQKLKESAANKLDLEYRMIRAIVPEDLVQAKAELDAQPLNGRVRFAVMPLASLDKMDFVSNMDNTPLEAAREISEKLKLFPGVEVRDFVAAAAALDAVKKASDEQWIPKMASELRADYVIWGSIEKQDGSLHIKTDVYESVEGKLLATAENTSSSEQGELSQVGKLIEKLMDSLMVVLQNSKADSTTVSILKNGLSGESNVARSVMKPVSSNARGRRELLSGLNYLESAIAIGKQDPGFDENAIKTAVERLKAASRLDPDNPTIAGLLASAYYNMGLLGVADDAMPKMYKALQNAFDNREMALADPLRTEIEADFALMIEKDTSKSIMGYTSLATGYKSTPLRTALRAHWMLAGIYCGDWNVEDAFVDTEKARDHIVQILAFWPDSPEAKFYRVALHWNDKYGTQHPHVPQTNEKTLGKSKTGG